MIVVGEFVVVATQAESCQVRGWVVEGNGKGRVFFNGDGKPAAVDEKLPIKWKENEYKCVVILLK